MHRDTQELHDDVARYLRGHDYAVSAVRERDESLADVQARVGFRTLDQAAMRIAVLTHA